MSKRLSSLLLSQTRLADKTSKNIEKALIYINNLFNENNIEYCVIGGNAVKANGYIRLTMDMQMINFGTWEILTM